MTSDSLCLPGWGCVIGPFPRRGASNRNVLSCRKWFQYKQRRQRSGLDERLITANGTLQTDTQSSFLPLLCQKVSMCQASFLQKNIRSQSNLYRKLTITSPLLSQFQVSFCLKPKTAGRSSGTDLEEPLKLFLYCLFPIDNFPILKGPGYRDVVSPTEHVFPQAINSRYNYQKNDKCFSRLSLIYQIRRENLL